MMTNIPSVTQINIISVEYNDVKVYFQLNDDEMVKSYNGCIYGLDLFNRV